MRKLLIFVFIISCSNANIDNNNVYITGGELYSGNPEIGMLYTKISEGWALCTATLIAPDFILTAAHCVPKEPFTDRFFVVDGGFSFNTDQHWVHPEWEKNGQFYPYDIAIIHLTNNVPYNSMTIWDASIKNNLPIKLIGYGNTMCKYNELGEQVCSNDSGIKRIGYNNIFYYTDLEFYYKELADICPGDSGGPTLFEKYQIGIHSGGYRPCGIMSFDTRVSPFISWIAEITNGNIKTTDGDICTHDECNKTGCFYSIIDNCCKDADECSVSSVCENASCVDNRCKINKINGCCLNNNECDDGNTCTSDVCLNNVCKNSVVSGCCLSNGECDDGNACTNDVCLNNVCKSSVVSGCCLNNNECDDGNACTNDVCLNNVCKSSVVSGCCLNNGECDDGNNNTTDTCTKNVCKNIKKNVNGGCSVSGNNPGSVVMFFILIFVLLFSIDKIYYRFKGK